MAECENLQPSDKPRESKWLPIVIPNQLEAAIGRLFEAREHVRRRKWREARERLPYRDDTPMDSDNFPLNLA